MATVFVHDHKFRKIAGEIYSPGGLSNEILSRYTGYFGSLTVISRILEEDTVQKGYSKITNPYITVQTNHHLKAAIESCEAVIIRLPSINGYKAVALARRLKKPYLIEVVGCTLDAYWNYSLIGKLAALPAYCIMRQCVKNAPYAVYVTKHFLQKRYPCNGKTQAISDVSLQSVDSKILLNSMKRAEKSGEKLVLGTAAAVDVAYKGQEYVIRALPLLQETLQIPVEYQLIGAGDPSYLQQVARQCGVENNLVCKGVMPHEQVFSWLDGLDIYLQPSLLEGLSRALLEAMSRALPCIATDCGGNPELLDTRCLVTKKNMSQSICQRVAALLEPEMRKQQIRRNYELATEQYNAAYLGSLRTAFYLEFAQAAGIHPEVQK